MESVVETTVEPSQLADWPNQCIVDDTLVVDDTLIFNKSMLVDDTLIVDNSQQKN